MISSGFPVEPLIWVLERDHVALTLHLPQDPALQHSLQLALRSRDDKDHDGTMRHENDDLDEDDLEVDIDAHDEFERNSVSHGDSRELHGALGISLKRFLTPLFF
ncbi:hypothetical protein LINPERHAP1_LOCUS31707 [Linum perenne]